VTRFVSKNYGSAGEGFYCVTAIHRGLVAIEIGEPDTCTSDPLLGIENTAMSFDPASATKR
jgi:hypothetical protein